MSNLGEIYKSRLPTFYSKLVQSIWYFYFKGSTDTRCGTEKVPLAIKQFSIEYKPDIESNGDKLLRVAIKFWDNKEPPMKRSNRLSRSNASILSIIYITTLRGCYVVSLPFKNDRPYMGDSYTIVPKIFHALEHAFVRNPALKKH
ncbi:hypothetical protein HZH66_013402 [Vespula vulgaris]|uniref:Uncharacterized protein n=1 Tax=Vespula vulgaris TaxID=7454 RepID=A0A834MSK4_VESVU|nr:hypothetical protein HZH66_013402 [Vespula vulgaris]